jgi:hypothetical protein
VVVKKQKFFFNGEQLHRERDRAKHAGCRCVACHPESARFENFLNQGKITVLFWLPMLDLLGK